MQQELTLIHRQVPDDVQQAALYLYRHIPGHLEGWERMAIARKSNDVQLRRAVALIDAWELEEAETVRPLGVVESGEKRNGETVSEQAGGRPNLPGSGETASPASPAPASVGSGEGASQPITQGGLDTRHARSVPSESDTSQREGIGATVPLLRTPAAFFARQLDRLQSGLRRLGVIDGDPSGYTATKPGPLGGPCPVAYMVVDDRGVAVVTSKPKQDGDDAPDIRRTAQRDMYRKKNRQIAEWGDYPAVSTEQNARRGVDPE